MDVELAFKIAFIVTFAVTFIVAARTGRQAVARHGGSVNQLANELRGLVFVRAALGILFYGALICWLFNLPWLAWMRLPLPLALRWVATLLLVPALGFFAWAFNSLGANYRGGVGLHKEHQLVTTGAYGFVRHPIYLGFITLMTLCLMVSANWALGVSGILLVTSIAVARIPVEERELSARFGKAWSTYAARTGRLLPWRTSR